MCAYSPDGVRRRKSKKRRTVHVKVPTPLPVNALPRPLHRGQCPEMVSQLSKTAATSGSYVSVDMDLPVSLVKPKLNNFSQTKLSFYIHGQTLLVVQCCPYYVSNYSLTFSGLPTFNFLKQLSTVQQSSGSPNNSVLPFAAIRRYEPWTYSFDMDSFVQLISSILTGATEFSDEICASKTSIMTLETFDEYRGDCCCNSPCYVPASLSVSDAIVEDTELLSSGDELDKVESDTDSQDTVIEGEAYRRMRSVAIKEKILQANEEHFGLSVQNEYIFDGFDAGSHRDTHDNFVNPFGTSTKHNQQSFSHFERSLQTTYEFTYHDEEFQSSAIDNMLNKLPSASLKEPFQGEGVQFSESKLASPFISEPLDFTSCSSPRVDLYSSESSECSDVEEIILSDVSSSSDEAAYIATTYRVNPYQRHNDYRLHTILEESCEESDRCSRGSTPISQISYTAKSNAKVIKKLSHKTKPVVQQPLNCVQSSTQSKQPDLKKKSVSTSHHKKQFTSNSAERKSNHFIEEDLTDESGGVSSDDDRPLKAKTFKDSTMRNGNHHLKALPRDKNGQYAPSSKKNLKNHNSKRTVSQNSDSQSSHNSNATMDDFTSSLSALLHQQFSYRTSESAFTSVVTKSTDNSSNLSECERNASESGENAKTKENVSDEEAKYIVNHVIQHISSNSDLQCQPMQESSYELSPTLKILESEIARLMLTVSPASLSAGEPSSSCSSTIGSNNSDYGSDTLESGDETTSEDDVMEQNRTINPNLPINSRQESDTIPPVAQDAKPAENPESNESNIADETLYICKQLMASLKKLADSTDATNVSDELNKSDDNTAKQYITDQIVSLMQTVNASQNNSPVLEGLNVLNSQDRSDSDSPQPNDDKRGMFKNKTPSESGSETTISASISIPSYDDSDRTPTESEISHEMDELYALLESSGCAQDNLSANFYYDSDCNKPEFTFYSNDSPPNDSSSEKPTGFTGSQSSCAANSLLFGAAIKLESLLPISIEERIARYNAAFLNKDIDDKDNNAKETKARINVILPQPSVKLPEDNEDELLLDSQCRNDNQLPFARQLNEEPYSFSSLSQMSDITPRGVTSVKIIPDSLESGFLESDLTIENVSELNTSCNVEVNSTDSTHSSTLTLEQTDSESQSVVCALPKAINPKEKASSENDLFIANYRAKTKPSKVFGTKSAGNISELESMSGKSAFRDTGYYSFKSSDESFLSLDDSTTSRTSTASLTQYRSLTSTETIPEEEESSSKASSPAKMSLSSGNIPFEVSDTGSASKCSTLPLSVKGRLSVGANSSHRTRSSFFSTSGVLRKLTLLRDESGNSLRSSPHGRMRMRHRTLSGGSDDGRTKKDSVPHISISECVQSLPEGAVSPTSVDSDNFVSREEDIDQVFSYHSRSQMSLSSFGGRSESVTSVYSAAGGGRYGTVIVTGEVLFSLCYNYKASVFEVLIKECRNLAPVDTKRNRSDPYVKIYLLPDRTKSGKRKTKVKKHTLNPVFDEPLKFQVTISEVERRTLWLSVWHSDRFGRNDFLGEVTLPLAHDSFENPELKWYPLQERMDTLDSPVSYKGDIILALKYVPFDVTSHKPRKKANNQTKGSLHVLVKEARNLMATRSNGTSDPFCKSYLLPDKSKSGKQKTPVLRKSCNPKWNHTFVYDDVTLDDLREKCLELTIWDYDKITSNDFLGGVRLCLGSGKHVGRDVDWMDSVGEEVSLWHTMIDRPNMWVDGSLLLRPSMQNRRIA